MMTPLTVSEARAILRADEALDATFEAREASGQLLGLEDGDVWRHLVKSAHDRIAGYEGTRGKPSQELVVEPYPGGNEPGFQTLFIEAVTKHHRESRTGYTIKRLTTEDAAHIDELLRVSIEDKHWLTWHPKLREIREKLIERLGDSYPVTLTVLACREGSSWVVQAIEQDVASQGASLLGAIVDLGCMFDACDQIIAEANEPIAANPRAPIAYEHAIAAGHHVGELPLGATRVAQVYIGISPYETTVSAKVTP